MFSVLEVLVTVMLGLLFFAVAKQCLGRNSISQDDIEGHEFRFLNMADVMDKDKYEDDTRPPRSGGFH